MLRADVTDFAEARQTALRGIRNQLALAGNVKVHLHLAYAQDDHLCEKEVFEETAELLGHVPGVVFTHQVFATGGHNIQKTQAEECAEAIVSNLQTLV
jgi:pimeloyl-ACP methyl ester carboxylesterase